MTPKRHVLLVWPIFQALYPRPFDNFAEILITAGRQADYQFGVLVHERASLVSIMNQLGERILKERQWEAAIVFDDDCFPPYDVIPRLLTRCFDEGHPFVAATGVMRAYPFTTTVGESYPEGISAIMKNGKLSELAGFTWKDALPNELVDADFCGVPAAIMHRRIFETIPAPWFGDMDERGERCTHDIYFCRKLKAAGIPIKVDGTIRCGHLVEAPIVTFDNRAFIREKGEDYAKRQAQDAPAG